MASPEANQAASPRPVASVALHDALFGLAVSAYGTVESWVRLQRNDLPILWTEGGREYNPDFIAVETDPEGATHWVVEVKMDKEMSSADVAGKREAARRWVTAAMGISP